MLLKCIYNKGDRHILFCTSLIFDLLLAPTWGQKGVCEADVLAQICINSNVLQLILKFQCASTDIR